MNQDVIREKIDAIQFAQRVSFWDHPESLFSQAFLKEALMTLPSEMRKVGLNFTGEVHHHNSNKFNITEPLFFFGIKSGARAKRNMNEERSGRESGCSAYYQNHGVAWKFMVGRPYEPGHVLTDHDSRGLDTDEEQRLAKMLLEEVNLHQDIVILPMRDTYMSLPDKLFQSFQYALWDYQETPYLGTHDVEYCVDMRNAMQVIERFEESHGCHDAKNCTEDKRHYLYAGHMLLPGRQSKGAEGKSRPFFSGWGYFLSRGLVSLIVEKDRSHSVLNGIYGTSADDVDMGKWVAFASHTHGIKADFLEKRMLTAIDQIKEK